MMIGIRILSIALLCIAPTLATAADSTAPSKPAGAHATTAEELVGVYKILTIPNELQPSKDLKPAPYQGPCQFIMFLDDGDWFYAKVSKPNESGVPSQTEECKQSAADFRRMAKASGASKIKWKKLDGGVATIDESKNTVFVWKMDTFERDIDTQARFGFNVAKGDIAMQLMAKDRSQVVWQLMLRRLAQ
jgi:hypothetical protein